VDKYGGYDKEVLFENGRSSMYMIYKMKAEELDSRFLRALKTMFKDKEIEIAVCEADQSEEDETEYLLKSPANRDRLLQAIENVARSHNLVSVDLEDVQ
jgi:antitoxin YefM